MTLGGVVKSNTYRDSVALMLFSSRLTELPGVLQASAMMGTPANKEILAATGLLPPALQDARANDLCIAVEAEDDRALERALAEAEKLLAGGETRTVAGVSSAPRPRTLESALRQRPDANLALISVPGEYAAFEARRALRSGLHVFLFSDNVPLEEEVELKRLAEERGLLVMGPDCGTAIIAGTPLGFANAVRRGSIGLVASSGTGLQEVTCLIDRFGEGVSHALGTGSRDLWAEVGGRTFLAALDALAGDDGTEVLVLVAKPGAPEVQRTIYDRLAAVGKPTVVYFLGASEQPPEESGLVVAADLEHAARCGVALSRGEAAPPLTGSSVEVDHLAERLIAGLAPTQRHVRGLFAGGTLAQEAATAIRRALGPSGAGEPDGPGQVLNQGGHLILDLGDDAYTRGRPHPLIDPRLRNEQIVAQAREEDVALILLDVILGFAAHPDPAESLQPALERAREIAEAAGRRVPILASITGTRADLQGFDSQRRALEAAGVVVAESSSAAAYVAARVAARLA